MKSWIVGYLGDYPLEPCGRHAKRRKNPLRAQAKSDLRPHHQKAQAFS
jgi:hypothetical protein